MGRRWVLVTLLAMLWPLLWLLAWRAFLFGALEPTPSAGVAVFSASTGGTFAQWLTFVVGVVFVLLAAFLLGFGRTLVRENERPCGTVTMAVGLIIGVIALTLPLLFSQVQSLIVDEPAEKVTLQTKWLYWVQAEEMAFADINRVQRREERQWISPARQACRVVVNLKLFAHNNSRLELPPYLRDDEIASAIGNATGKEVVRFGDREC